MSLKTAVFLGLIQICMSDHLFDNSICGIEQSESWLAGNPWLAAIKVINETNGLIYTRCAGVLINERYVLTTATCMSPDAGTKLSVIQIGPTYVQNFTARSGLSTNVLKTFYTIEKTTVHHQYDFVTRKNDVALVRLKRLVKYAEFLQPVCLPYHNIAKENTFVTSTWRDFDLLFKSFPTGKDYIKSSALYTACDNKEEIKTIEWKNNTLKLCNGYIGAPLMFIKNNKYFLQGLLLKNVECDSGNPALYLNVSEYLSWIKENVESNYRRCLTPDNQQGVCMSLNDCPILLKAFANPKDSHYLSKYICSDDKIGGFQVCCSSSINSSILLNTNTTSFSKSKYCGYQKRDEYLSKDEDISVELFEEFPWVASIRARTQRGDEYSICSGSLINEKYVLTSAYCILGLSQITSVRLGEYNVMNKTDCVDWVKFRDRNCIESIDFEIEEIVIHPFYNLWTYNNDIALIRLKNIVFFSDYIRPICLPTLQFKSAKLNDSVFTTSFSAPKVWGTHNLKKKLSYTLVENNVCQYKQTVNEYTMCLELKFTKYDPFMTCFDDDGAPAMSSHRLRWVLEGITTERVSNCDFTQPIVVTKVSSYLPWIKENVRL